MHSSIKSNQKRPKQNDAPYDAQERPKTIKTKRRPIRRPKATKNDQKRNDAQNDAQEQDDTLSLARISTMAQMARSLAYRDGSMAHLFAYRRRLKWLAYRDGSMAHLLASQIERVNLNPTHMLSRRIGHKQHPRARPISRPSLDQA